MLRLLPEFLSLSENLGALHPEQEEHGHDGKEGRHCIRDDVLQIFNKYKIKFEKNHW